MNILPPLNDHPCLAQVVDQARTFTQTAQAQALADQLTNIDELAALIDALDFRADTDAPNDGPASHAVRA